MAQNTNNMTPTVEAVRRMESHEIVKYLGIPFGHQVTKEQMLATLTTRFYRGFVVWDRTKTLAGWPNSNSLYVMALYASSYDTDITH
ncbi:hypothetical protein PHMEG_00028282 [Phytophthora megakarya]|uniref:Uncharacterized protein n=1 Tax=Phytophthora megakarya TaxID=4795 RepID=A0A225V6D0_9STRA|nr:hypothetical protein PHMEG_00028282 [Phytophthora megakarya]